VRHSNSVDKIVSVYLAGVTRERFVYNGLSYVPKSVLVSPLIFRNFRCVSACGACCGNFSLDYLPNEESANECENRPITFNGGVVVLRSDTQKDVNTRWCRHLDRLTGLCKQHDHRPFSCDFEPIRFLQYQDKVCILQKSFGRSWAMERLDGIKGARCQFGDRPDQSNVGEVVRKFLRLFEWAEHFGLRTCVPEIIEWALNSQSNDVLWLRV
jgi:Fe-S-cluster containining protein